MRDTLNRRYDRYLFDGTERVTWKRAVLGWGKQAAANLREGSVTRYKHSLRMVRSILDGKYIDEIDRKTIARIAHRAGVSNTTRRRDLTAVSSVLSYCVGQGWLDENVARTWDRSVVRERRDPFTEPAPADIAELEAAGPAMWAAAMRFARASGMREEEIFSLERSQFRPDGIMLTRTKTNSPRMVPWLPRMKEIVDSLPTHISGGYVFWHGEGARYHNCASQFLRIRRQANAARRKRDPKAPKIAMTFHGFRHLFAIEYLRTHGRDRLPTLSQILGHTSIKTTEWYVRYLPAGTTKGATAENGL